MFRSVFVVLVPVTYRSYAAPYTVVPVGNVDFLFNFLRFSTASHFHSKLYTYNTSVRRVRIMFVRSSLGIYCNGLH